MSSLDTAKVSRDSLLFFYLLLILIFEDMPYCIMHPTNFQLFFLLVILLFEKYYVIT